MNYLTKTVKTPYCVRKFQQKNWPWPSFSAGTLPQSDIPRIFPWSNLDFFNTILDFFNIFVSIYIKIKSQVLMKYNIAAKKSKFNRREILRKSLCGSLPAEKLGHGQFFLWNFFTQLRLFTVLVRYFMYQKSASSSGGPCVLVQKGALSSSSYSHD